MRSGSFDLRPRVPAVAIVVATVAACAGTPALQGPSDDSAPGAAIAQLVGSDGQRIPPAPETSGGPLARSTRNSIDQIIGGLSSRRIDHDAVANLGQSGDPRVLWFLNDVLLFSRLDDLNAIRAAFELLTSTTLPRQNINEMANHLIAWDLPAPPGYREVKRAVFTIIEPKWAPFFDDESSIIDWRLVAWGGVLIDDRFDAGPGQPCDRCIPALDDPPVTDAAGGRWYPDDRLIFGVVINGEARAYPKHIMEVHEMVNDTLGERRIGIPYCTLCGSAQAYYTDDVDGFKPVLRTSGLLARSNKLMYDISTMSAMDTFSGRALSGPLHDASVVLNQVSVVTSTWGGWKRAYPETTIVAEDGGLFGRSYRLDPLRGRDNDGPIFAVGDVDPRLNVQELVLGVEAADGTPVAFPVGSAVLALRAGQKVEWDNEKGVISNLPNAADLITHLLCTSEPVALVHAEFGAGSLSASRVLAACGTRTIC